MIWTINYKNELIEGDSYNELFNLITKRKEILKFLYNGNTLVGYREGKTFLEIGRWYLKDGMLFYEGRDKQKKNKDGEITG